MTAEPIHVQATCDTCKGKGNLTHRRRTSHAGYVTVSILCPSCEGKGVVKKAVVP